MSTNNKLRYILGFSGGSGVGYALRLLNALTQTSFHYDLIFSETFYRVLETEHPEFNWKKNTPIEDILNDLNNQYGQVERPARIRVLPWKDVGAEAASGSAHYNGMAVVPCSMKTLASIANGITTNLIERASDVCLKERRPLILVPRETPYHLIHLRNMQTITEAGGIILPASPGFYHKPQNMNAIYDFIVDRILQHLKISYRTIKPWKG